MRILGIETSCDETSLALVKASGGSKNPKFKVIHNLVASQIKIHRPFGGVVPNLAKREHLKNLPILLKKLNPKRYTLNPDLIAVTVGPGLEPALWTGITFGKELYQKLKLQNPNVKLVGANHLEGHLYSFLLPRRGVRYQVSNIKNIFPAIALIVSGGHTILLLLKSLTERKKLGETRDDAVGEAFDKVARLLGLLYPGGPEIEKLARKGNQNAINFPRPMLHTKDYDFSFSGLKTSVLYYLRDNPKIKKTDVAASFQQAAIDVLVAKTARAARELKVKSILLSGGVAANKLLRETFAKESKKIGAQFIVPDFIYNTDNAAMIAAAGYIKNLQGKSYHLIAQGDLNI